jgi:peptidoglycan hydrolase-like amidase
VAAREWAGLADDPDLAQRFLFERPDAWCNHESYRASYRWSRGYSLDELSGWVDRKLGTGALIRATPTSWTTEGWLTGMDFEGEKGKRSARRDAVRGVLFVARSNHAVVEFLPAAGTVPAQVFVVGAGWGHGAGMCQDGVLGLANTGHGYRDILAHYYPSARMERIYR